ncbi:MAG: SLC13 family permease [Bacilli bacterium]
MMTTLVISILTVIFLILAIIYKPEIKVHKFHIETFWLIAVIGVLLLLIFDRISIYEIGSGITEDSSINPLKILILFLSMTVLSVILDELGFFKKLAYLALKKAKGKQMRIFMYLYVTVSVLTIFTSNDIIILTFTPFICYFSKNAKINPLPYLISEFVAANTWSMMLVIGNPTNIYLASSYGIDFLAYFGIMFFPTVASSLIALGILILLFKKQLSNKNIEATNYEYRLENPWLVGIMLFHLISCMVILAISSYIGWEMWLISLSFAFSALCVLFIYETFIVKRKPQFALTSLKRAPWSLIPFVVSMFAFVLALNKDGITNSISHILDHLDPIIGFGLSSFFSANIINNIPMTILYSNILQSVVPVSQTPALYAAVIGSNIGAYLTPIGALAGIMWMQILKKQEIDFSFPKFIKYGSLISIPTIMIALLFLMWQF